MSFRYAEPPSPLSPATAASALDSFLDDRDDPLEWVADWEQRSNSMDQKHVDIFCSHWRLMRDAAKEHSQVLHQMKRAMHDLRSNGLSLQDRLEALERRLREELRREQQGRLQELEDKLGDALREAQGRRLETLARSLRDDIDRDLSLRLEAMERRLAAAARPERDIATVERALREELSARTDRLDRQLQAQLEEQEERLADLEKGLREDLRAALAPPLEALEARLREDSNADRLEALERQLRDRLAQEQAGREDLRAALAPRLDALERRLREEPPEGQAARLETLERRLRERILQEQASREAAVADLSDQLAAACRRLEHRTSAVEDALEKQQQRAPEVSLEAVRQLLARELELEATARERCVAPLRDRVDALAKQVAEAGETVRGLQDEVAVNSEKREQDQLALYGRLGAFQDKIEQQLKRRQGALDDQLRELLAEEKLQREQGLAALREALGGEGRLREDLLRSLRERLERELGSCKAGIQEVQGGLARERTDRDRHCDAVRAFLQEQLAELQGSVESRVEQLLRMLHDSASGMRRSWEHCERAVPL